MRQGEWPWTGDYPRLVGQLRSGEGFVVEDAVVKGWFPGTARVGGARAICSKGLNSADEAEFESVLFQVGGLTEMSGTVPFRIQRRQSTDEPLQVHFTEKADHESRNGEDKVVLTHLLRMTPRTYGLHLRAFTAVEVIGPPRTLARWIEEYVEPVQAIASLALAEKQPLSWVTAKRTAQTPGGATWKPNAQVFGHGITQEPIQAEDADTVRVPLWNLHSGSVALSDLISGLSGVATNYRTFYELVQTVLSNDVPLRAALLALAPALESYHYRKHGHGPISREDHRAKWGVVVDKLKKLVEDNKLLQTDLKWIKSYVNKWGGLSLAERLRDLYLSLDPAIREIIAQEIDPMPQELQDMALVGWDIWDVIAKLRNDLAHGNEPPDLQALTHASHLCHTVSTAILLAELNAPPEQLVWNIEHDRWTII